ncbi:MAG: HK97 family phage prohead protease [Rhodobacteraceae bacterium]|nr:HK97 family phage prohead protease [Paracoccaceae bacterium]
MLWGAHTGGLELRTEGGETRLRATFPYGRETVLSDGGRTGMARKEIIAARAFGARIAAGDEIHLLAGHDFNKPLASRSAGTLELRDTEAALIIDATISAEMASVSYVRDFLSAHAAGLIRGLSPGFRIAQASGAEVIEERGGALVRTVRAGDLFEVSAVTRPAYPEAQIEARSWTHISEALDAGLVRALARWRA